MHVYVYPCTIFESSSTAIDSQPIKSLGRAPYKWTDLESLEQSINPELVVSNLQGRMVSKQKFVAFCYFFRVLPYHSILGTESNRFAFDWNAVFLGSLCPDGTSILQQFWDSI